MAKVTFAIWPCFAILAGGFSGVGVKNGQMAKMAKKLQKWVNAIFAICRYAVLL